MISIVYQILLILSVPNGPALARLAQRRQCRHLHAKPFDLLHIIVLNGRLQERIRLDQLLQILIALRSRLQHIKPPSSLRLHMSEGPHQVSTSQHRRDTESDRASEQCRPIPPDTDTPLKPNSDLIQHCTCFITHGNTSIHLMSIAIVDLNLFSPHAFLSIGAIYLRKTSRRFKNASNISSPPLSLALF